MDQFTVTTAGAKVQISPRVEVPLATKSHWCWDSFFILIYLLFLRQGVAASQQYHVHLIRLQDDQITFQIPRKEERGGE